MTSVVAIEKCEGQAQLLSCHEIGFIFIYRSWHCGCDHSEQALQINNVAGKVSPLVAEEAVEEIEDSKYH